MEIYKVPRNSFHLHPYRLNKRAYYEIVSTTKRKNKEHLPTEKTMQWEKLQESVSKDNHKYDCKNPKHIMKVHLKCTRGKKIRMVQEIGKRKDKRRQSRLIL